ncbi:hypothetical protein HDU76_002617 [Blyttiomyces sp. JEL0837]|nr:hypothetical protein HDU76_002617 [Blyttiomyces sp. JEL0837]
MTEQQRRPAQKHFSSKEITDYDAWISKIEPAFNDRSDQECYRIGATLKNKFERLALGKNNPTAEHLKRAQDLQKAIRDATPKTRPVLKPKQESTSSNQPPQCAQNKNSASKRRQRQQQQKEDNDTGSLNSDGSLYCFRDIFPYGSEYESVHSSEFMGSSDDFDDDLSDFFGISRDDDGDEGDDEEEVGEKEGVEDTVIELDLVSGMNKEAEKGKDGSEKVVGDTPEETVILMDIVSATENGRAEESESKEVSGNAVSGDSMEGVEKEAAPANQDHKENSANETGPSAVPEALKGKSIDNVSAVRSPLVTRNDSTNSSSMPGTKRAADETLVKEPAGKRHASGLARTENNTTESESSITMPINETEVAVDNNETAPTAASETSQQYDITTLLEELCRTKSLLAKVQHERDQYLARLKGNGHQKMQEMQTLFERNQIELQMKVEERRVRELAMEMERERERRRDHRIQMMMIAATFAGNEELVKRAIEVAVGNGGDAEAIEEAVRKEIGEGVTVSEEN